jgi:hypothetical protein
MNGKFRHIQAKNGNEPPLKKKISKQKDESGENNTGKNRLKEKIRKKAHKDKIKSKLNKSAEFDERRVNKHKKEITEPIEDNSNGVRSKSTTKRKIKKNNEPDNPKKIASSSYEKRNLNSKKQTEKNKELKSKDIGIKKTKKVQDIDDGDETKLKRRIKKTKTELPQQTLKSKKLNEMAKKAMGAKKITQREKEGKNNNPELKISKFKKEDKNGNDIKKGKKFLKNKERTKTTQEMKKKIKKKEEEKEKGKKGDEIDKQEKNNDNMILLDEEKDDEELDKKNDKLKFTLFDYMWIFNPAAKNNIIRLFNVEQQRNMLFKMLDNSRREREFDLLNFFFNRNKFNLMLNIRRDHLIEDTLNELSKPNVNLQSELKVKFVGEQGVDEGGVRKEFFILLIRQIFDPNYCMFSYNKKTRLYWFNHYSFEPKIKYELIGKIFGLAIYNNTILDVKLPIIVYKKLLGIKPNLDDMKECDPELYHTLNYLVNNNDENLKEELDTNFTVIDDKFGEKLVIPLKPNGENILIDINNKDEYVDLYIDWYFNKSIHEYFNSFEKGFYCVFKRNLSKFITPDELELIICGTQLLDFNELKKACQYEEYTKDSETIKYFWEILLDFNEEEKKKFLSFVTGCDRAPIDGLGSLPITVSNGGTDLKQLPSAHTCFNNLILPDYKDKEKMKKAILTAINYSEGFGLI